MQERRAAERGGGTRPRSRERGLGGSGRRSRAVLNAPRILPCAEKPRRAAFAPWFVFLLLDSFCFLFFARLREPAALRERALLLRCEGKARKVRCYWASRSYWAIARARDCLSSASDALRFLNYAPLVHSRTNTSDKVDKYRGKGGFTTFASNSRQANSSIWIA